MDNMDKINDLIKKIGELIIAVSSVFVALGALVKRILPVVKLLAFLATQLIPNGVIVWAYLYIAANHADRLTEPNVFLSLAGQEFAIIVIYNFIWGIWLYPALKRWLFKEKSEEKPVDVNNSKRPKGKK